MAQASKKVEDLSDHIYRNIRKRINLTALGNSDRTFQELAIDLINDSNESYLDIAIKCFLCEQTVKRLANEETRYPQSQTIERILRHFGMSASFDNETPIKARYANKPKPELDD